jgi:ComF family protein
MALPNPIRTIIDYALPPRCAGCGAIVDDDHRLCLSCWQGLRFLPVKGCPTCNAPMQLEGQQCGPCMANPPSHDGVWAAVGYGDVARSIVLKFKHGRRPGVAGTLARHLHHPQSQLPQAIYAPVPLHRWRIWSRGFNQSLLIAKGLNQDAWTALVPDLLIRKKATAMLKGLGSAARAKEVRGAFMVNPAHAEKVKGQAVCLVDDVYTSGATLNACAHALKKAGATHVYGLCWARVLHDADQDAP